MSWQPYALAALAIAALGAVAWLVAGSQFEQKTVIGAVVGGVLGLALMLYSVVTLLSALKEKDKKEALGHVFGGFLLRLVVLAGGVFGLKISGAGNPMSFALAFVAAVLLFLGFEVYWVNRSLRKDAAVPRSAAGGD